MAKKKEPSIENAIDLFKEVMHRASLSNYYYVNRIIISKNNDKNSILVIPDQTLWNKLLEDEEWKTETKIKEVDISKPDESKIGSLSIYGEDLETDWFPIELDADLYTGKIFKIKMNNYEYTLSVNRDLMPMKLKKSEYEGISYKVFSKPLKVLAIKKRFDGCVDDSGFTIIRLFQII